MLDSLKSLFGGAATPEETDPAEATRRLELASAALLFEVLKADHELDPREIDSIADVLRTSGKHTAEEVDQVIALARRQSSESTSLYEFTSLVNEHGAFREKCALIRNMWRIAYADAELSKYEDYVIRKVCDLIHVPHSEFIRAKLAEKSRLEESA